MAKRFTDLPQLAQGSADDVLVVLDASTGQTKHVRLTDLINDFVDAVHIKTDAIIASKLLDGAVEQEKLNSNALPALGYDSTVRSFAPGNTSRHAIAGWEVTFDVVQDNTNVGVLLGCNVNFDDAYGAHLYVERGADTPYTVSNALWNGSSAARGIGYSFGFKETLNAGSYTYVVKLAVAGSVSASLDIRSSWIMARPVQ